MKQQKTGVTVYAPYCDNDPVVEFEDTELIYTCPYCRKEFTTKTGTSRDNGAEIGVIHNEAGFNSWEYQGKNDIAFILRCKHCLHQFKVNMSVKYEATLSYTESEVSHDDISKQLHDFLLEFPESLDDVGYNKHVKAVFLQDKVSVKSLNDAIDMLRGHVGGAYPNWACGTDYYLMPRDDVPKTYNSDQRRFFLQIALFSSIKKQIEGMR